MYISNCCSDKAAYVDEKTMTGLCMGCCEWCEVESDDYEIPMFEGTLEKLNNLHI
jgi:hypothetical protein